MRMLLSTTALAFVLGFPTLALSQAAAPATDQTKMQQAGTMPGFLATRGPSDVFASDLIGHDVYARRTSEDMTRTDGKSDMKADGTHGMATLNRADRDAMDNIGQINEIVLSNDGQVRAVVIGVGGFLGMGERDVAVTMDQVTFASDSDDRSEMYIIVNTRADTLKDSPAYDRTTRTDAGVGNAETRADSRAVEADRTTTTDATRGNADRSALVAPTMARDGYNRVEAAEVSAELLMGKSVYDVNDNDVGTVTDMIVDDAGTIKNVIIDFGGFLGMGKSQVSIGYDELTILSNGRDSDVRIYVDATKEQIQNLPQYQAQK